MAQSWEKLEEHRNQAEIDFEQTAEQTLNRCQQETEQQLLLQKAERFLKQHPKRKRRPKP